MYFCPQKQFCCDTNGVYQGCCSDANNFLHLDQATASTTVGAVPTTTSATSTAPSSTTFTSASSSTNVASIQSATASPTPSSSPSNKHRVVIAVGVAVPLGIIIIIAVGVLAWWRRRSNRQQPNQPDMADNFNGGPPGHSWQTQSGTYMDTPTEVGSWGGQSQNYYHAKVAPEPPQELPAHFEQQELDSTPK
jgi:hypothetical protein